ncbi:MAG: hypothetical protein AB7R55_18200 [Gemmatimonadales bacterium]
MQRARAVLIGGLVIAWGVVGRELSAQATPAQSGAGRPELCKLFSAREAGRYLGTAARAGEPSTGGCQWVSSDDEADMIVQLVPADYHEPPRGAAGFKPLPEAGADGFVARYLDGWQAGAILGKEAIRVTVAGPAASEQGAAALLTEAIRRLSRPVRQPDQRRDRQRGP